MKKLLVFILFMYGSGLLAKGSKAGMSLEEQIQEQILQFIKTHVAAAKSSAVLNLPKFMNAGPVTISDSLSLDIRGDSIIVTNFVWPKANDRILSAIYVYSNSGTLISRTQYNGTNSSLAEYNSGGQLTVRYLSNGHASDQVNKDSMYVNERCEYDKAGRQIAEYHFSANGQLYHTSKFIYDAKSVLIEQIDSTIPQNSRNLPTGFDYSEFEKHSGKVLSGKLFENSRIKYLIDSSQRTVITEEFTNSVLATKVIKVFDQSWRPLKAIHIVYPNPQHDELSMPVLDAQSGPPTAIRQLSPDTTISTHLYTQSGINSSDVVFVNGQKALETITTVNENNDPIEVLTKYDDPKFDKKATNSYDTSGNLIKQVVSEGGQESSTTTTIYYR